MLPILGGGAIIKRPYFERVLETAYANLIGYWPLDERAGSIAYDLSGKIGECIINGGFEVLGAGGADVFMSWAAVAGTGTIEATTIAGEYHGGMQAAKLTTGATGFPILYQEYPVTLIVTPNTSYTIEFWTRGDGINAGSWSVYDRTNGAWIVNWCTSTGITSATYAKVSRAFTIPANCIDIGVYFMNPGPEGAYACFDDVSLLGPGHGRYTGVTFGEPGIGDGRTSAYLDGSSSLIDFHGLMTTTFPENEGTIMGWAKIPSAEWTNGKVRYVFRNKTRLGADMCSVNFGKLDTNNTLFWQYVAGNIYLLQSTATLEIPDWFHCVVTWSVTQNISRAFLNGVQVGADSIATAYNGTQTGSQNVIGAGDNLAVEGTFIGWVAHCAVWSKALTAAQIAYLSRV